MTPSDMLCTPSENKRYTCIYENAVWKPLKTVCALRALLEEITKLKVPMKQLTCTPIQTLSVTLLRVLFRNNVKRLQQWFSVAIRDTSR